MEEILASIRRIIADDQGFSSLGMPALDPEPTAGASRVAGPHAATTQTEALRSEATSVEPPHLLREALASPELGDPPRSEEPVEPHQPTPLQSTAEAPPSPIRWTVPDSADDPEPHSQPAAPLHAPHPVAHGEVKAPQYAGPDGRLLANNDEPARHTFASVDPLPPGADSVSDEGGDEPSRQADPIAPAVAFFDEPIEPPVSQGDNASGMSSLFSAATDSSVSSAFNVLAASRLAANSDEIMTLVRELIRPLLRNWLDDNLPSMVERMVRDEIERVARGGR